MKFYLYIADAKIETMLAALRPDERERLARDLDLDPAFLEPTELRRSESDEVRFARAAAIARQLEVAERSGLLEAEAPFIAATLSLHWGRLRHMRAGELLVHETESPVAFAFSDAARDLIMFGSARQLLAQPPSGVVDHAREHSDRGFAWFAPSLRTGDQHAVDADDRRCFERVFEATPPPTNVQSRTAAREPASNAALRATSPEPWMERLARVRRELRALPVQRLEVVAKRLATFTSGHVDPGARKFEPAPLLVLAAPIFVAMVV